MKDICPICSQLVDLVWQNQDNYLSEHQNQAGTPCEGSGQLAESTESPQEENSDWEFFIYDEFL